MIRAMLAALIFTAASAAGAHARPFAVPADHTTLIRLPGAAAAIVVGNPEIADASLYDSQTVFLTGKIYGRTNLIALDSAGEVIYTSDLVVTGDERSRVRVYRNTARESYVCAPQCEAAPLVGDDAQWFNDRVGQRGAQATPPDAGSEG